MIDWVCPVCGWMISDEEHEYARVELDCPGCGTRCLSEFIMFLETPEPETEPYDPPDWWKRES